MSDSINPALLRRILLEYQGFAVDRKRESEWWRAEGEPFVEAVRRAALSYVGSWKHSHQRRIPQATLNECASVLTAMADRLENCRTFDEIFQLVKNALGAVTGAGEMIIYDVADRIALRRGIAPDRIYLHRGTRDGAMALIQGIRSQDSTIRIDELPRELQVLSARELEDVLCIFKSDFVEMGGGARSEMSKCRPTRPPRCRKPISGVCR